MLKMYHKNPYSGNTPDYWENSWDSIEFEDALELCSKDPLKNIFDKYVKKDSLILEGGCGKGHWVAYFADRNYKIVGLDFAQKTLAELAENRQSLSLCCGNVNMLPFADNSFDVYYSGGVVEHFEGGCMDSLSEARRVIKEDGTLLLSVPYYSPLRKILTPFRTEEWRKLSNPEVDEEKVFEDLTYFQYAYTAAEFKKLLVNAGLHTIETFKYSVIWGLYDVRFLNERAKARVVSRQKKQSEKSSNKFKPSQDSYKTSLLKKLIIGEDTSNFLNKTATKFMQWSSANMIMFGCRKK